MKATLLFDSPSDLVDFIDEIAANHFKPLPEASQTITGEFRDAEIELARNAYGAQVQLEPAGMDAAE